MNEADVVAGGALADAARCELELHLGATPIVGCIVESAATVISLRAAAWDVTPGCSRAVGGIPP